MPDKPMTNQLIIAAILSAGTPDDVLPAVDGAMLDRAARLCRQAGVAPHKPITLSIGEAPSRLAAFFRGRKTDVIRA